MARVHLGTIGALAAAAILLSCQRGEQDDRGRTGRSPEAAESRREARAAERREEARSARAAPARAGGRPSAERPEARGDATARDDAGEARRTPPLGRDGTETRREGALSHAWQGTVEGRVVRANEQEIVLRVDGPEPDVRLRVAPDTAVTVDGARSSVAELREGTEVRASFAQQGGEPVATRIEAL